MGLCDSCKDNRPDQCTRTYHTDANRKGQKIKSISHDCDSFYHFPRAAPAPEPRWPRLRASEPWLPHGKPVGSKGCVHDGRRFAKGQCPLWPRNEERRAR